MTTRGLELRDAVKTVGGIRILDGVSFAASPGRITALLGPNGAGKSTALRALVGQAALDSGVALIDGLPFSEHRRPVNSVGVLLSPEALHAARTVAGHLAVVAAAGGLPAERIARTLTLVGLEGLAKVRIGELSLGMRQRLALAAALLAEPDALILDEPHNGLDAGAIRWLRLLLRAYADSGRTVLVSSHLLGELQVLVDDVVVIAGGRVVASGALNTVIGVGGGPGRLEDWYFAHVEDAVIDSAVSADRRHGGISMREVSQ